MIQVTVNGKVRQFEGDPEILEERKFTLQQIAPCEQDAFGYEYDFGDS